VAAVAAAGAVAVGVAEDGALLAELVPPGVLAAGVELTAAELLAPGELLVAGAVEAGKVVPADGDGDGDGLAGADLPSLPPPRVVPCPGSPCTRADSGLPAARSNSVIGTAQPMNAMAASATGPAQRRFGPAQRPG